MKMTFDAEACTSYIRFASHAAKIDDSCPLDITTTGINLVVVDVDADRNVLGIEILGRLGDGPESIRAAIADESIAGALAAEGFDCPKLRGNPSITIQHMGRCR